MFLLLVISDRGAGVARSERALLARAGGVQVHLCQQAPSRDTTPADLPPKLARKKPSSLTSVRRSSPLLAAAPRILGRFDFPTTRRARAWRSSLFSPPLRAQSEAIQLAALVTSIATERRAKVESHGVTSAVGGVARGAQNVAARRRRRARFLRLLPDRSRVRPSCCLWPVSRVRAITSGARRSRRAAARAAAAVSSEWRLASCGASGGPPSNRQVRRGG